MVKIKNINKKIFILLVILTLVAVVAASFYIKRNNSQKPITTGTNQESINYDPPTAEEIKFAEDNKKRLDDEQNRIKDQSSQQADASKKVAKPTINFAEQNGNNIEVGSYIATVFEDGGTCKLELVKDTKVTREQTAVKEGSATYCPTFSVPKSELSAGTWTVTVSYSSATSSGTSDSRQLVIN